MKTKAKYLTAILFLASVVMYFIPFMGWKKLQLRLFDLVQIGFGNKRTETISQIVNNLPQSQMSLFGYVILGAMLAALVGAVLSVLLRKDAPYFVTVILSVLINIAVVFSVLFIKQKMEQIEQVLKLNKTLGGSFELNKNLVYIWIGIFAVNIVVSLLTIALPDKKQKKDTRVIYTEQPVTPVQPQERKRPHPPVQPVNPPVQPRRPVVDPVGKVPQQKKVVPTAPVAEFHGAIVGKCSRYQNKVYPLEKLTNVYVQIDANGDVYLTKNKMSNTVAAIYYVDQYQEYCVTPEQKLCTYLGSGQPLGVHRDYYLSRGSMVYFETENNSFQLA